MTKRKQTKEIYLVEINAALNYELFVTHFTRFIAPIFIPCFMLIGCKLVAPEVPGNIVVFMLSKYQKPSEKISVNIYC